MLCPLLLFVNNVAKNMMHISIMYVALQKTFNCVIVAVMVDYKKAGKEWSEPEWSKTEGAKQRYSKCVCAGCTSNTGAKGRSERSGRRWVRGGFSTNLCNPCYKCICWLLHNANLDELHDLTNWFYGHCLASFGHSNKCRISLDSFWWGRSKEPLHSMLWLKLNVLDAIYNFFFRFFRKKW